MRRRELLAPGTGGRAVILILFLAAGAACGPGRPAAAAKPAIDLAALQREIIEKLAGAAEIAPGVRIPNRFAPENKTAARTYLSALWTKLGLEVQAQDYSAEGENLYAIVRATTAATGAKDETVIVGAHYDSVRNGPGANDNATGVALVTALAAEILRTEPRTRNFLFILFDEEERGMRGSRAFAQKVKDEGLAIHSVHTADQVGWDSDKDRAVELEIPYEGALALYEAQAKAMTPPVPLLVTKESGSDHSAFRRLGFDAVGITEEYRNKDTTPYIHRPTDTADTVDLAYLANTTDLVLRVMKSLARS
jgi:Zn-dependent M28 family amino/carboxypeptidase